MKRLFVVIIGVGSTLFGLGSLAAPLDFVRGEGVGAIVDDSGVIGASVSAIVDPAIEGSTFSPTSGEGQEVGFLDLVFDCEAMLCEGPGAAAAQDLSGPASNAAAVWHGIDFSSLLGVLTAGVIDREQPGVIDTGLGDFSAVFADLANAAIESDSAVQTTSTALGAADASSVPLPPALWLFLAALLTLAGFNSRKRRGAQPLPSY